MRATEDDALQWTRAAVAILAGPSGERDRARIARAVEMLRDAAAATPETSPDLPGRLSNLSGALQLMHAIYATLARTGSATDSARAVHAAVCAARHRAPSTPSS